MPKGSPFLRSVRQTIGQRGHGENFQFSENLKVYQARVVSLDEQVLTLVATSTNVGNWHSRVTRNLKPTTGNTQFPSSKHGHFLGILSSRSMSKGACPRGMGWGGSPRTPPTPMHLARQDLKPFMPLAQVNQAQVAINRGVF